MSQKESKTINSNADRWIALLATGLLVIVLTFAIIGSVSAKEKELEQRIIFSEPYEKR